MKRGNIVRIKIDRAKYGLSQSNAHYGSILIGTVLKWHRNKISVKCIDIWGDRQVRYLTIDKSEVVAVL